MAHMLPVQLAYKQAMAAGKTAEATAKAREVDKASHAELNRMRAQPCNAECFDCTATKPGWAVLPHGVFVCIDCAQVHRNIGRHVSQTKAVNTGTYLWYPRELQVMREIGNGRALAALRGAPPKPSRDAAPAVKEAYARAKYEERKWGPHYDAEASPPAAVSPVPAAAPAPAAIVTPRQVAKPRAGLEQARRLPVAAPQPEVADLISLDAPPAPAPAPPSVAVADWAVWEQAPAPMAATGTTADDWAVWEEPVASGWDSKKAEVLSCFQQPPHAGLAYHANVPQMQSPALFFAQYGL